MINKNITEDLVIDRLIKDYNFIVKNILYSLHLSF